MSKLHFPLFRAAAVSHNVAPAEPTLTVGKLIDAARLIKTVPAMPQIIVTVNAVKQTDERLFPESRNRSRRIHKKLVKRFGGEFRKVPGVIEIGDKMFVHPAIEAELKQRVAKQIDGEVERALLGSPLTRGYRGLF